MQTNESCRLCEKIIVTFELHEPMNLLLELPNTYNPVSKKYEWRDHDLMAYAMIPQSIHGGTGIVDFYICLDEDNLDDLDLVEYVKKFLRQNILSAWGNFKSMQLFGPILTSPIDLGCWKIKHEFFEGRV